MLLVHGAQLEQVLVQLDQVYVVLVLLVLVDQDDVVVVQLVYIQVNQVDVAKIQVLGWVDQV